MPFGRIHREKKYTATESLVHFAVRSNHPDPAKKMIHYVGIVIRNPGRDVRFKHVELVTPSASNHIFISRSRDDLRGSYKCVIGGNKADLSEGTPVIFAL